MMYDRQPTHRFGLGTTENSAIKQMIAWHLTKRLHST